MQRLLRLIYPHQCALCEALVEDDGALCGSCWADVPFILGLGCDQCGAPLPGDDDGQRYQCDDCLAIARPWSRGRSALIYSGKARSLVLGLKHGDRLDLARPAARWMLRRAEPLRSPGQVVVPVPAHWRRTLRRRFNQAAVLAGEMARQAGCAHAPLALRRTRATGTQEGRKQDARFANVDGAIAADPHHGAVLQGADVLLVDDVITSGATLGAATSACLDAGARRVQIVALARVVKET